MYIVFEPIEADFVHPDMVFTLNFLGYNLYDISNELANVIDLEKLNAELLTQEVGDAAKFYEAVNGKVMIKPGNNFSNIALDNESGKSQNDLRNYYTLTEQDQTNCSTFIKAVLKNFATKAVADQTQRDKLIAELDKCNTVDDCNWFMWDYMGIQSYLVNRDRQPKFEVNWTRIM